MSNIEQLVSFAASELTKSRRAKLRRLLSPRHLAFVGGRNLVEPLRQAKAFGFAGPIWAVNPKLDSIEGIPCFRTVNELPEAPDATFLAVPREPSIEVVRDLASMDAGGVIGYAAGFAELGAEGAELQRRLIEAAGDLALVGPNCYGLLNAVEGVALWASGHGLARVERGAAIVAQSGNLALNVTMNLRSVPFAHVISMGNQACLGLADFIAVLAEDPRVTAIALYLEGITDVAAFADAAIAALERAVPIVALKAGASELGSQLAVTHTSSLAGDDALYDALFERLAIARARSVPELLETVKFLSVARPLSSNRLAVFTCSGGDSLMVADAAGPLGIALPQPTPAQEAALQALLPDFATVANPLDYNTSLWGNRKELVRCFSTMFADPYDAALLVLDYPHEGIAGRSECDISVDALIEATHAAGIPAAVGSTLPELIPAEARARMIDAGVVPLQGLPEALTAISASMRYGARREEIRRVGLEQLRLPRPQPLACPPILFDEVRSKSLLADCGLSVPMSRTVAPSLALEAALEIGFPVVLKVLAPFIAHKTETGAVVLGVASAEQIETSLIRMEARLAAAGAGAIETVLVEKMITDAVAELIVGVVRDEGLGLALVIGAGGVLAELVNDAQRLLLPTSREAIGGAISRLTSAKLLHGYRGCPPGDVEAAIGAIAAVAAFAESHRDRLVELDVNPLLVRPQGRGAVAVDALVRISYP
ncbi:MAG TPA: acetate--CoA ligase family protein [Alphaproteobacteria bacterium]|nr:acetate--CoA ligase family protein [Alphaproteobacteria bacterium]